MALGLVAVFGLQLLLPCGTRLIVSSPTESGAALTPTAALVSTPVPEVKRASRFAATRDLGPWEALQTWDCWLLVWTDMICQGCNTALSNNLGDWILEIDSPMSAPNSQTF